MPSMKREKNPNFVHGMQGTPEYRAWYHMKERCYKKTTPGYKNYGGRGIKVCDEWKNDFSAFYSHIGKRPSNRHTLDRINNDGNYEPGNVRWAGRTVQVNNKRTGRVNKHGYIGIFKNYKKWGAVVNENNTRYFLGNFDTKEEAAITYDCMAVQIKEVTGKLNFLTSPQAINRLFGKDKK